jgi:hypothetical protein
VQLLVVRDASIPLAGCTVFVLATAVVDKALHSIVFVVDIFSMILWWM